MNVQPPNFTPDEMNRNMARKVFAMQVLADRVAGLTLENVELMAIIQELQTDLAVARQTLAQLMTPSPDESPAVN